VPYNNLTSRTDAEALIPEEVSREFLGYAAKESAAMTQFRRVPVAGKQVRFPVLSALPLAYFVNGDTGLKQTTEVGWANKYLNIEEVATIVPIPENVVDDIRDSGNIDIWSEVQPAVVEAIGRCVDGAVFLGTNAPATWPDSILESAVAAGNDVLEGSTAAEGGFYNDIDNVLGVVEADGFDATGFVAARTAKGKLRQARNSQGDKLDATRTNAALTELDGLPISYPMRGLFPSDVRLFAGDWSQFVLGVRQDITFKLLTEAVIQDNTGAIVYNLAQQDMVAMRIKIRLGWQVANLLNNDQPTEADRYPVGVLNIDTGS
jgi:HK97 family phage major capsid protein